MENAEAAASKRKTESILPQNVVKKSIKLWISYIEIYNENVNDLLDASKRNLQIREDHNREVVIDGVSRYEVKDISDIFKFMQKGNEAKMTAEHKLNEKSSRSHTVFRIEIVVSEKNMQTSRNIIHTSEINLVDLAGSEGVAKAKSQGIRLREGHNINKSLLALSNVIHKLGQKCKYINFRDSKLTRIL